MVVAGHDGSPDHAPRMIRMAMDMIAKVQEIKQPNNKDTVQIRIGIHSGPAYAGKTRLHCFQYQFFLG
jgi:class 3 adenylate cyclase